MGKETTVVSKNEQISEVALLNFSEKIPYKDAIENLEKLLGYLDQEAALKAPDFRKAVENMAGELGLMTVHVLEMGALIPSLGSAKTQARQYLIGNPLIASQMAQYDPRVALLAPPRVLVYGTDEETFISYEKPSSSFGRLQKSDIHQTASDLDVKFETLVTRALSSQGDS